jgi:hypothetical protein
MVAEQQRWGVAGKLRAEKANGRREHMQWQRQREDFCGGVKKGHMRSMVNPFNLADEVVGPLDVRGIIWALCVWQGSKIISTVYFGNDRVIARVPGISENVRAPLRATRGKSMCFGPKKMVHQQSWFPEATTHGFRQHRWTSSMRKFESTRQYTMGSMKSGSYV